MEEEKSVQEIATPVREGRCGHRPLHKGTEMVAVGADAHIRPPEIATPVAHDDGSCAAENVGEALEPPYGQRAADGQTRERQDPPLQRQSADIDPHRQALVETVVRRWSEQAQEAKKLYPGLDMSRELQNPRFSHLLKSGVDVRTAFEVVHRDQILPAAMHAAAKAVEKKLTSAMAGARPAESAMESASAALTKTDVAAMSKADRADIIRRVRQGEKIRF